VKNVWEAWRWYEAATGLLTLMQRLGSHHWDELPWEGRFGRDDHFRALDQERLVEDAARGIDLSILVLFSVFESQIRQHVYDQVEKEAEALKHPSLQYAASEALRQIEEGSFFRVLEPFEPSHANLVEEVNQVRQYRNWVAHGRQGEPTSNLDPRKVYDRLGRFLIVLGLPTGEPEATAT
jgi:hypothetical protein